jgi:hypothetical protein
VNGVAHPPRINSDGGVHNAHEETQPPCHRAGGGVERNGDGAPDRSDLDEGARLVREILKAIPSDTDEPEDAVVRNVVEGIAGATELASEEAGESDQDS